MIHNWIACDDYDDDEAEADNGMDVAGAGVL